MSSQFPFLGPAPGQPHPEIETRVRQLAPSLSGLGAATPTSIYSPPVGTIAVITSIFIVNNDNSGPFRGYVYHDEDGTTYTVATRILNRNVATGADEVINRLELGMENTAGNLAVEDVTGSKLTFTVYGYTRQRPL